MRRVGEIEQEEQRIWEIATKHSIDYQNALGLSDEELKTLQRHQPVGNFIRVGPENLHQYQFLQIPVGSEVCTLTFQHVFGVQYKSTWSYRIIASCTSSPKRNRGTGNGTTTISVIDDELHKELVEVLKSSNPPQGWEESGLVLGK